MSQIERKQTHTAKIELKKTAENLDCKIMNFINYFNNGKKRQQIFARTDRAIRDESEIC
ncbi:unnamed protein product [Paramecium sonneborni]|uniref:Uncharacterized protein n=1 Tax=Paramecium sonneborni TaxID=65129 RepID=A0A8S1PV42_9CILI|nr:unnamed protein product [Paramecium sonneborni]